MYLGDYPTVPRHQKAVRLGLRNVCHESQLPGQTEVGDWTRDRMPCIHFFERSSTHGSNSPTMGHRPETMLKARAEHPRRVRHALLTCVEHCQIAGRAPAGGRNHHASIYNIRILEYDCHKGQINTNSFAAFRLRARSSGKSHQRPRRPRWLGARSRSERWSICGSAARMNKRPGHAFEDAAEPHDCLQTWQVVRGEFDLDDAQRSRARGVRDEGTRVFDVLFESDRAIGVTERNEQGSFTDVRRWLKRRLNMANRRRRKTEVGRSPVTEDRLRPMGPGTQGPSVTEDVIRTLAYELYRQRGGQHGGDWDDWFRAERELRRERSRGN
jgi:hypothetical protein